MFFCTRIHISLILATLVLVSISTVSSNSARKKSQGSCDNNRLCKYGGTCDSNSCRCNFDCNTPTWPTTIYCGPKKPNKAHRQYYSNLCMLLAHACERQADIPIIRLNSQRVCEDEIPLTEKLCPNAEDFMGPCGGSIASGGLDGGVCLQDVPNGNTRCVCSNERTGSDCQSKLLQIRSVHNDNTESHSTHHNTIAAGVSVAVFSIVCCLVVVIGSFCIITRYKSSHTNGACNSSKSSRCSFSTKENILQRENKEELTSVRSIKSLKEVKDSYEKAEIPSSDVSSSRANLSAVVVVPTSTPAHSQTFDKNATTDSPVSDSKVKVVVTCLMNEQNNNNCDHV